MTIEDMLKELGDVYRQISPSKPDEVSWKVCVLMSDGKVQKQDAASLYLASATIRDYLTLGAAAWMEDDQGTAAWVIAAKPPEKN